MTNEQRILNLKDHFLLMSDTVVLVKEVEIDTELSYMTLIFPDFSEIKDAIFTRSDFNIRFYENLVVK